MKLNEKVFLREYLIYNKKFFKNIYDNFKANIVYYGEFDDTKIFGVEYCYAIELRNDDNYKRIVIRKYITSCSKNDSYCLELRNCSCSVEKTDFLILPNFLVFKHKRDIRNFLKLILKFIKRS